MRLYEIEQNPIDIINKYCQQYLKDNPNHLNTHLYRGMRKFDGEYNIFNFPEKRKPMNISVYLQDVIDIAMKDAGLKAIRSNSIFCTGNISVAKDYGSRVCVVYPFDNYYFSYSETIDDLYYDQKDVTDKLIIKNHLDILEFKPDDSLDYLKKIKPSIEKLEDYTKIDQRKLKNVFDEIIYRNGKDFHQFVDYDTSELTKFFKRDFNDEDMSYAIKLGHEILITGDKFLAIEFDYFEENLKGSLDF